MADFSMNVNYAKPQMTSLGDMVNMASGIQNFQQTQQMNPLALQRAQQEVEQARQMNPLALEKAQIENQVLKHGKIEMASGKGAGGYFASRSMSLIKADVAAGNIGSFDATAAPTNSSMVHNTDRHGPVVTQNLNNVAKGLFTYPSAGAMLWVFFREGNPLFPVYFAASYSSSEWKSAYGGNGVNPDGTNQGSIGSQVSNSLKLNPLDLIV